MSVQLVRMPSLVSWQMVLIPSSVQGTLTTMFLCRAASSRASGKMCIRDSLGWETQSNLNVGVDFDAFDNRLHSVLNIYHRITDDMLMFVPKPYATGFSGRYENVGSLTNTGADLTLSYDIVRTRDWNVYAATTLNYNVNRVTKLFYDLPEYKMPSKALIYKVGQPTQFLIAEYAGVNPETGKQQWYVPDADGNLTSEVTEYYDEAALLRASGKDVYKRQPP